MGKEPSNRTTLVDDDIRSIGSVDQPPPSAIVRVLTPAVGLTFDVFPVSCDPLIIGRNPPSRADALIDDGRASRRHAAVRWIDELQQHAICDMRSTNGTFLNSSQIDREFLTAGDVIRIGNSLFVYCTAPPEPDHADDDATANLERMIGRSTKIRMAIASLDQVAPTDLKVLITGETGTGKELAANRIHRISERQGPFVPVNCGAFPATLIESELFGYTKGAFSGADRTKEGLITSAHGGTLFLDEIGEFPLSLQPRLLRVLQDQQVRPVGATTSHKVDVRVVTATNRDILQMADDDLFRRDLLSRLNEWPVHLPPLDERREDMGLLVAHFLDQRDVGNYSRDLDADLFELMLLNDWPGNVRDLSAAVARIAITVKGGVTDTEILVRQVFGGRPPNVASAEVPSAPNADQLRRIVALFEGNISGVARYYGKERQQIYRWLDRFDIAHR